jgi:hypothetical protein
MFNIDSVGTLLDHLREDGLEVFQDVPQEM